MSGHDGMYKHGKKMFDEMCAEGGKTQVKAYARGGAVKSPNTMKKADIKSFPKAPPKPTPTSRDTPPERVVAKAKGGKIKINPENKGKLRKALGVPAGKKIPEAKLAKAAKSSNPVLKKRAVFAENAKEFDHKAKGGKIMKKGKK